MKKSNLVLVSSLLIASVMTSLGCTQKQTVFSESDAILAIQDAYPEYAGYPNDDLPPQSIRTEQQKDGWYVAFLQEGSGRPLISAQCFFINKNGDILSIGKYENPTTVSGNTDFSLETCQ